MKFGILQSTILEYRLEFYRLLKKEYGVDLTVCAGEVTTDSNQKTPDSVWSYATKLTNRYCFGGCLLWQGGAFTALKDQPLLIVDANLRFVSTVLLVLYRYIRGLPTVAWGHAEGRSHVGKWIRKYYFKCFSGVISYTESQQDLLRKRNPRVPVWSAFNACLREEDCYAAEVEMEECTDFIYVGRLSDRKKPKLLLDAFIHAAKSLRLPAEARLVVIGEGAIRPELMKQAAESGVEGRIVFTGAIHDTKTLKQYYRHAIAAVSPGYVGLSVTQACGLGVPMLVARDEPHSPEVEVCREGFNARFFASDDMSNLATLLQQVYNDRGLWYSRRKSIAADTRGRYSIEKMYETFCSVYEHFKPASQT